MQLIHLPAGQGAPSLVFFNEETGRVIAPKFPPVFTEALDGSPEVLVRPVNAPVAVTLDRPDYDRLLSLGVYPSWVLVKGLVRAKRRGMKGTHTIARLIMDAPRGRQVRYRDGNPLNLRRQNLSLPALD